MSEMIDLIVTRPIILSGKAHDYVDHLMSLSCHLHSLFDSVLPSIKFVEDDDDYLSLIDNLYFITCALLEDKRLPDHIMMGIEYDLLDDIDRVATSLSAVREMAGINDDSLVKQVVFNKVRDYVYCLDPIRLDSFKKSVCLCEPVDDINQAKFNDMWRERIDSSENDEDQNDMLLTGPYLDRYLSVDNLGKPLSSLLTLRCDDWTPVSYTEGGRKIPGRLYTVNLSKTDRDLYFKFFVSHDTLKDEIDLTKVAWLFVRRDEDGLFLVDVFVADDDE